MKSIRKSITVLLVLSLSLGLSFAAEQSGLVVRSPLFASTDIPQQPSTISATEIQAYDAQLGLPEETVVPDEASRVLNAISNGAYPVTPGDVYSLSYLDGLNTVTVSLQADEAYRVTIPGLGTVEGKDLTFNTLKQQLLSMVTTYHRYSNPQLSLVGTGAFTVAVVGEVGGTRFVPAWGLSRLSSVVKNATSYASTRAISVRHADGSEQSYDLFLALRKGRLDQDPLLQSGDVITIPRAERIVVLTGNVYAPGTYQLAEGEDLADLVSYYGGGAISGADLQRVRVRRFDEASGAWQVQYVDLFAKESFALENLDRVIVDTVPSATQGVVIEGAISSEGNYEALSSTALLGNASGRLFYQFYPGETFRQMLQTISPRLMTVSDLEHAYIDRDGQRIDLDIKAVLYGNANPSLSLHNGDVLTIPFIQRFVTVGGAVVRPNVYAYVPDKPASYYLSLAGGLDDDASVPNVIRIEDSEGNKLQRDALIPPEATIEVKKDTFVKDLAPTVAVIGLVSSIVSIIYYVTQSLSAANVF